MSKQQIPKTALLVCTYASLFHESKQRIFFDSILYLSSALKYGGCSLVDPRQGGLGKGWIVEVFITCMSMRKRIRSELMSNEGRCSTFRVIHAIQRSFGDSVRQLARVIEQ